MVVESYLTFNWIYCHFGKEVKQREAPTQSPRHPFISYDSCIDFNFTI